MQGSETSRMPTRFKCNLCNQEQANLILTRCINNICISCFTKDPYGCPFCRLPNELEEINQIFLDNAPNNQQFECRTCFESFNKALKQKFCACNICWSCFKQSCSLGDSMFKRVTFRGLQCANCSSIFDIQNLKNCLDQQRLLDAMIKQHLIIECPQCKQFLAREAIPQQDIQCPACRFKFCKYCQQRECNCDSLDLINTVTQNTLLASCPRCRNISFKGSGCDSMHCMTCGEYFCMGCSCLVSPLKAHGHQGRLCQSYHRPYCKYKSNCSQSHEMSNSCQECLRLRAKCSPPQNLRTKRYVFKNENLPYTPVISITALENNLRSVDLR